MAAAKEMAMSIAYSDPATARSIAPGDEIPVLDFGPYRAGENDALKHPIFQHE